MLGYLVEDWFYSSIIGRPRYILLGFQARMRKHNLLKVTPYGAIVTVRPVTLARLGLYELPKLLAFARRACSARSTSADRPVSCETARPNSDFDPTLISGSSPGMIVPMRTATGSTPSTDRSGGVSTTCLVANDPGPGGLPAALRRSRRRRSTRPQVSVGTHARSGRYCSTFGIGVRDDSLCVVGSPSAFTATTQQLKSSAASGTRCGRSISPVRAQMTALSNDVLPDPFLPSKSVSGEANTWL